LRIIGRQPLNTRCCHAYMYVS